MGNNGWLSKALDWLMRFQALTTLLAGLGGGTLVKAVLSTYSHLPDKWITPIWLTSTAILLWLGQFAAKRWQPKNIQQQMLMPGAPSAPNTTGRFDAQKFLRLAYISPLQSEVEANMRNAASAHSDKESFYLKLLTVGAIAYAYDSIWWSTFSSQVSALLELNRNGGLRTIGQIHVFYDNAVESNPEKYANYSFDQWVSFVTSNTLWIRHPSDMVEITVKGKDFLKYLLHWGREASQRSL
jgi:hypothetical protein